MHVHKLPLRGLYELVRAAYVPLHQPRSDLHPTTAKTRRGRARSISNQSWRSVRKSCHSVREKAVTRFWKKLVIDPVCPSFGLIQIVSRPATEGLPTTWPRCTKYQNSFPTIFLQPLTVRLPHPEHLPSNYFISSTLSQAPNQPVLGPQANLLAPKLPHKPGKLLPVRRPQLGSPYRIHPPSFS